MKIEWIGFWPFLIGCKTLIDVEFIVLHDKYFLNFEIDICNIELLGLYIDPWKTHLGLLGFGMNVWYNQTEEKK